MNRYYLILLLSLPVYAAPESKNEIQVQYGDKTSTFQIIKNKKDFQLHFDSSYGESKKIKLNPKEIKSLESMVQALEPLTPPTGSCPRKALRFRRSQGTKVKITRACLAGADPLSQKLTKVSNIMATMISTRQAIK